VTVDRLLAMFQVAHPKLDLSSAGDAASCVSTLAAPELVPIPTATPAGHSRELR
jgi:hypothetical protein